ncbi:conserved hypothetical protein [Altererythrobacter sp. B11]|uniref:hypothetical protein n=1 Tax=Altererythrobacter sp. B11 TaxID=2060312 RepID=UPI000DC73E17|nr:hypothetical protein [Altererythrobacter sp. B11]BBC74130.1 conserved hypothetical protein [Altererythrobacter sp. B11]
MQIDPSQLLRRGEAETQATGQAPFAGTRAQAVQRLQVGFFGLAAMVLLLGLANIIMFNAERNRARSVPEAASTVSAQETPGPVSDPLADAGIVPDLPAEPAQPAAVQAQPPMDPAPTTLDEGSDPAP